ncbi:MAG: hypothetical protein RL033_4724 [Pseudomonadota bacterium]|jgi:hypothetical protein
MASIRENGRYGSALFVCITMGCVSTDEPLFKEGAVPESRTESVEASAAGTVPEPAVAVVERSLEPVTELLPLLPMESGMTTAPQAMTVVPPPLAPPAAAPSPPAGPAPPAPCPAEGLLLCESFEQSESGTFPGEPWLPELPGCGTHRVESSASGSATGSATGSTTGSTTGSEVSHSGSKSLGTTAGGYPECMLHAELDNEPELYLRSWVRLGAEPQLREQYLTLLELGPREDKDEPELRIGLRPAGSGLCGTNPGLDVSVSGLLGSGPVADCSGVQLEPERWYCLQAHVVRDGRRLSYELSLDEAPLLQNLSELRLGASWNDDLYFKVGRAAYGTSPSGSLWHDDVAVSRSPLPCGASAPD